MKIASSFDHIISPATQQAIENGCTNAGIDSAFVRWANENSDHSPIYDVYDSENEEYSFSIDTDGNVIFER